MSSTIERVAVGLVRLTISYACRPACNNAHACISALCRTANHDPVCKPAARRTHARTYVWLALRLIHRFSCVWVACVPTYTCSFIPYGFHLVYTRTCTYMNVRTQHECVCSRRTEPAGSTVLESPDQSCDYLKMYQRNEAIYGSVS